jgi:hypothetical protein
LQEEVRISKGGTAGEAGNAVIDPAAAAADGGLEDAPEPLDMAFPRRGLRKQITYLLLFPIILPLWLTLPDTRSQKGTN